MDQKSKHHDDLVHRGYERIGGPRNADVLQRLGGSIRPVFEYDDCGGTIAFDELGSMWRARSPSDLTDLGFEKSEDRLNEVCRQLGYF
jgi:hypothetical protein